jgi:hypothetical protein
VGVRVAERRNEPGNMPADLVIDGSAILTPHPSIPD